jgi:hypothetical protein
MRKEPFDMIYPNMSSCISQHTPFIDNRVPLQSTIFRMYTYFQQGLHVIYSACSSHATIPSPHHYRHHSCAADTEDLAINARLPTEPT